MIRPRAPAARRHFPRRELPGARGACILAAMNLTPLDPQAAPDASKPILDGIASDLDLIPNMAATIAASPTLLAAFDGLRRAVGAAQLDAISREVAGVAVGAAVDNRYGVAFHSTVLGSLGVDEGEIDRMRAGTPPQDERLAAVFDFARAVTLERGKVEDALVERLTAAGYSSEQLLEVVAECTFAGLVGVVDNLAGHVTLDEFLAPRAWN
jgi:alkylhydroperoxidase family enzyme